MEVVGPLKFHFINFRISLVHKDYVIMVIVNYMIFWTPVISQGILSA